jgi:hypothetical protein
MVEWSRFSATMASKAPRPKTCSAEWISAASACTIHLATNGLSISRRYAAERVAIQIVILSAEASALIGLEAALNVAAVDTSRKASTGCMGIGIGAICEFGRSDDEIASLIDTADRTL